MIEHVYGILETANAFDDKEDRIFYIRENRNYVTDALFKMAYRNDLSFDLPPGEPPYRPSDILDSQGNFYQEIKRIERTFLVGTHPTMTPTQREALFIGTLEYLDPDDARLLIAVKDRKINKLFKNLNEKFIKEALPELF